jgi:hypothetical protein
MPQLQNLDADSGDLDTTGPGDPVSPRRSSSVRFFLVCWLLFSVAGTAWSLATPLFGGPDEPYQVVRAVAIVHGQPAGQIVKSSGYYSVLQGVRIPAYYGTANDIPKCFAHKPDVAANCAHPFTATDRTTAEVLTSTALYPPLYHALVGAPSLVLDGARAVYGMRLLSVLISAALLAGGMTALRTSQLPRPALAAGLIAVTPMTLFLASVVNPSGMEIAAGFATWAVLLPLVLDPRGHHVRRRLLVGTLLAVVLVNIRPGSALLALLIAVSLATVATRTFWREVRPWRVWGPSVAVAVVGSVAALAWIVAYDPTRSLGGSPHPQYADPVAAVVAGLRRSRWYLEQQIGVFGWLDVRSPLLTVVVWAGVLGVVLVAALAVTGRKGRLALLLALVLTVVVPVVSQVHDAAALGLIWQGRYLLPYSAGLPLLAYGLLLRRPQGRWLGQALVPVVAGLVAVGQVAALVWNLWRYAYGLSRTPVLDIAQWAPPGGDLLTIALILVAMAGLVVVVLRAPRESLRLPPAADPAPVA